MGPDKPKNGAGQAQKWHRLRVLACAKSKRLRANYQVYRCWTQPIRIFYRVFHTRGTIISCLYITQWKEGCEPADPIWCGVYAVLQRAERYFDSCAMQWVVVVHLHPSAPPFRNTQGQLKGQYHEKSPMFLGNCFRSKHWAAKLFHIFPFLFSRCKTCFMISFGLSVNLHAVCPVPRLVAWSLPAKC